MWGSPSLIFVPRSLVDRAAMTDLIIGLWIPLLTYKINKAGSFSPHYMHDVDFGSNLAFSHVHFQILPCYDAGIWYESVESNKDVCYTQMNLVQIDQICSPIMFFLKVLNRFHLIIFYRVLNLSTLFARWQFFSSSFFHVTTF